MRNRLIAPEWLRSSIPEPHVLEGDFDQAFLEEKNSAGWNAYFMPNYPSTPHPDGYFVNGRHIDTFQFVFVDCDMKDGVYKSKEEFLKVINEFEIAPSMIVDSGNGIHVYWQVYDLTREDYIMLQLQLIQKFKTDDSVWTVMQLMRVPETLNTKDQNNIKECKYLEVNDVAYRVEELAAVLPPITEENLKKAQVHLDKLDGTYVQEKLTVNRDELPYKFTLLMDKSADIKALFENPLSVCKDRSSADYKLCNYLFELDYSKAEAYQVILNTNKALSRSDRDQYAWNLVDKIYSTRPSFVVPNAAERNRNPNVVNLGGKVNGPVFLDDTLINRWRKKQVLGLIGGSKAGKTSVSLKIIYDMATRNPDNDDVYVFFSLEMTEGEILEKWNLLTGGDESLCKRLYIVSNEDEEGNPRHLGLQEVYWFSQDISKYTGKRIGALVIDHVGIISNMVDITKFPNFDATSSKDSGHGDIRRMTLEFMCSKFKELAKMLDCFLIIQSQTTKDKAGEGDIPLGIAAAYGVSQFEWYCDYVMSIWQPLKRVYSNTNLRITAWWYCGIRNKHQDDTVKEYVPYILSYDLSTGDFRPVTEEEMLEFQTYLTQANAIRARTVKK